MRAKHTLTPLVFDGLSVDVLAEIIRAQNKHPLWPNDPIHAVAIVVEGAGEAQRAALQATYEDGDLSAVRAGLVQTAATCYRAIAALDREG